MIRPGDPFYWPVAYGIGTMINAISLPNLNGFFGMLFNDLNNSGYTVLIMEDF